MIKASASLLSGKIGKHLGLGLGIEGLGHGIVSDS